MCGVEAVTVEARDGSLQELHREPRRHVTPGTGSFYSRKRAHDGQRENY